MKKIYSILLTVISFICMIILFISLLMDHPKWSEQDVVSVIILFLIACLGFVMGLMNYRYITEKERLKKRIDREIIRANMQTMREYYKNHIE